MSTAIVVDNNFVAGFKTDYTGLNFPENACIDTSNMIFKKTGLVTRRGRVDIEEAGVYFDTTLLNQAITTYTWYNVDGTGLFNLLVVQVGSDLHFYRFSHGTETTPVSQNKLSTVIAMDPTFIPVDGSANDLTECQFADGNGFLFVFNEAYEPFYVTYDSAGNTVSATEIKVKIRDTIGVEEPGVDDTRRPLALLNEHRYNLSNQGWGIFWETTSSTSNTITTGAKTFTVAAGLPITAGDNLRVYRSNTGLNSERATVLDYMQGVVNSYTSTTLVLVIFHIVANSGVGPFTNWIIAPDPPLIDNFKSTVGTYPSNADVWWRFKDKDGIFTPGDGFKELFVNQAPAPKGHFILEAFSSDRNTPSGLTLIPGYTTNGKRPSTGAWFAGRVWYAGIPATGQNERLYFSQIIEKPEQFGRCHQVNDPTDEILFDILPSDGGFVSIQGAGSILKLFPIINGLVVFCDNGVWFITGSQGIGFTATDYTITKVSNVNVLSHRSFVNVLGNPFWWNEEGIYTLQQGQGGGLQIVSITDDKISNYFHELNLPSKVYARGAYNPKDFTIQWCFSSSDQFDVTSQHVLNRMLVYNVKTDVFYKHDIDVGGQSGAVIAGIEAFGGHPNLGPAKQPFKHRYLFFKGKPTPTSISFAEMYDADDEQTFLDWPSPETEAVGSAAGNSYDSFFTTGHRIYSKGMLTGQIPYMDVFVDGARTFIPSVCDVQVKWDFCNDPELSKWSQQQRLTFGLLATYNQKTDAFRRRLRVNGSGIALQTKFSSVGLNPFHLIGWSTLINQNKVP